jgi:hypothetical protein
MITEFFDLSRPAFWKRILVLITGLFGLTLVGRGADWQWSVPMEKGRAFLWIPPNCTQVRAVIVGQNNMIEQGILEHPDLRKTLNDLGMAEVWIAPPFDGVFRFDQGAGEKFEAMMKALADESGYGELAFAPIVPLGHSACASYPWNFAAWNPDRTLAVLSVHGDAPQTNRTGSGHPNPDWGNRTIDGVPGLMVMGEYEWVEDRILPALDFQAKHPQTPLAMLAEPASGHYNYNDQLVDFLAMFIRKAAVQRLPADEPLDKAPVLKPIDPKQGWLVERWHLNQGRTIPPAPYSSYNGDRVQAFWCFDEEMADAVQNYSADQPGKLPQLLSITDGHMPAEKGCGEPINLHFYPDADGVTFHVQSSFMDTVPGDLKNKNPARWAYLPAGTPLGHASGGGPIRVHKIVGPVKKISDDTFALRLDRNAETTDGRLLDIWLWASHPGDDKYKSIVQQAVVHVQPNTVGAEQHITFPAIPDQKTDLVGRPGEESIKLEATSDSGLPVYYYVREGPAEIHEGKVPTLVIKDIPPRSKLPIEVTIVAWQWGRTVEPAVKTATPVEQTFSILK